MGKNIVILSTFDWGGAGESALRITCALRKLGHNAILIVKEKTKEEVFIKQAYDNIPKSYSLAKRVVNKITNKLLSIANNNSKFFTNNDFSFGNKDENIGVKDINSILRLIDFKPDLVIAAWVTYFINTRNMREIIDCLGLPIYWLTTDMAPLTGGCHYAWDCLGYTKNCANCPAILTHDFKQLARHNLSIKRNNIKNSEIKVLAGSEWCRRQAMNSMLFCDQPDIMVLNGVIDQHKFNNSCRDIAKKVFGVSKNTKLVFTGSTFTRDNRKGIIYLIDALKKSYELLRQSERDNVKIMIAGYNVFENELVKQIPFEVIPISFIKDDRLLSLAYQASDLFVCSSIEDSGPMMVTEALACGTPVVGFDIGFVSDIVEHGENGFRVPLKDTRYMAECINKIVLLSQNQSGQFEEKAIKAINRKVSIARLEEIVNVLTEVKS